MKLGQFVNNYKKNLKGTLIMLIVFGVVSVLMLSFYSLSKDLGLVNFGKFSSVFCFISFLYILYEFVMLISFLICEKVIEKKSNKSNIEKLIDEEIKKGEKK